MQGWFPATVRVKHSEIRTCLNSIIPEVPYGPDLDRPQYTEG